MLGLDTLAAGLALGALGQRQRLWRVTAAFTSFGAVAPLVGSLIGAGVSGRFAEYGEWLGAAVLGGLGVWMTVATLRGDGLEKRRARQVATGGGVILLAASLSLDNLVVGFGMGMRGVQPLALAAATGLAALLLTVTGILLGDAAHRRWEQWAQLGAGLLLIALAAVLAFVSL